MRRAVPQDRPPLSERHRQRALMLRAIGTPVALERAVETEKLAGALPDEPHIGSRDWGSRASGYPILLTMCHSLANMIGAIFAFCFILIAMYLAATLDESHVALGQRLGVSGSVGQWLCPHSWPPHVAAKSISERPFWKLDRSRCNTPVFGMARMASYRRGFNQPQSSRR
jgi:hypothetical protein